MKKLVAILILSFLLITPASAVSIDLKESYSPGQTILVKIEGNFIDSLEDKQIYFYEGRISLPILFDIAKFQDKYYIYAILPVQEKNFTLVIKDARYLEATKEYKQDIMKNFSVSGDLVDFSVSPGFVITNKDFEIKIQSIAKPVTVNSEFLSQTQQTYVPDSQIKKLKFAVESVENSTMAELKISSDSTSYLIPVLIISNATLPQKPAFSRLRFSPSSREIAIAVNEKRELNIRLENTGEETLENIEFIIPEKFKDMLVIAPGNLDLKESESAEIIFNISSDREGYFEDLIEATSGNTSAFFNLSLSAVPKTPLPLPSNGGQKPTCAELRGQICRDGYECSGEVVDSQSGSCCLGDCEPKPASSWKYVWILLIVLALLGIGYFLLKKYKKPGKSATELLKQRQTRAEQRIKPIQSEQVRGKLDRF